VARIRGRGRRGALRRGLGFDRPAALEIHKATRDSSNAPSSFAVHDSDHVINTVELSNFKQTKLLSIAGTATRVPSACQY
jgi:hypothetical protein